MFTRFTSSIFVLSAAALLSACGGGGGSSSTSTTATTTSGYAAKGIIKGAKVLVCRITGGAVQADASCATGTTGVDGSYSVSLADGWTGPVLVKVMPATGATMMNELTGLDETFDVEDGLRAVVASAGTAAQVTPFSEIAAAAAVASGTVDTAAVNQANAMVQSNFGIDLSTKPVVDLKESSGDSAAMGQQIAMVQKLAQVVNAGKNGQFKNPTTGAACTTVACGISAMKAIAPTTTSIVATSGTGNSMSTMNTVFNTTVAVNVPIRKSDGTISVQTIDPSSSSSIQTKLAAAGLTDSASLVATIKSNLDQVVTNAKSSRDVVVAAAGSDGKMAYTPPSTTSMAAVEQAKTMAKFMREAFNRFSNSSKTGYLDKQNTRIEAEVATYVRPDVEKVIARVSAITLATELYDKANGSDAANASTFTDGGKTYFYKSDGTVGDMLNGKGDYTACKTEKVSTGQASTDVFCYFAKSGSGWTPRSTVYTGMSADLTNVVGATNVLSISLKPLGGNSFQALTVRQVVAMNVNNASDKSDISKYQIPAQSPYSRAGPYDFDLTTKTNTYNAGCLNSAGTAYDYAKRTATSTKYTCFNYVGVATVERVRTDGNLTSVKFTGTLPPSSSSNTMDVGYVEASLSSSTSDMGGNIFRNTINGSATAYETAKTGSVEVDTSKMVKYELAEGSYAEVKRSTSASGVVSDRANSMYLKLTYTGYQTKGTGIITASGWTLDKKGINDAPTSVVFDGTISDLSSGGDGDVLKGVITIKKPKYAEFDSTKAIASDNDDGNTLSFVGSVNAKNSTDYIKTSLGISHTFNSDKVQIDSATIRFEIAGGFVLEGTGVSNAVKDKDGTIKLKNQDGIRFWSSPNAVPTVYASDETTVLGKYKDGNGGKAFYFVDGSIIGLN